MQNQYIRCVRILCKSERCDVYCFPFYRCIGGAFQCLVETRFAFTSAVIERHSHSEISRLVRKVVNLIVKVFVKVASHLNGCKLTRTLPQWRYWWSLSSVSPCRSSLLNSLLEFNIWNRYDPFVQSSCDSKVRLSVVTRYKKLLPQLITIIVTNLHPER